MDEDHNTPVRIIKKNKRAHGGHHGGAWKVAYADFVTAMMALFIVLWIVGQSEAVKQTIAAYFKDPGVFESSRAGGILPDGRRSETMPPPPVPIDAIAAEMEKLKTEAGDLRKAIADVPDFSKFKDKVQVAVTQEGLRIDLVEDSEGLFFDIGKATVKPETVKLLKMIAAHLARLPNGVVIEGYTDARPYASAGYSNWNLSADRANSARTILEGGGLRDRQILEVRGFADRKLKVPDKPLDYSNRRVCILVTPSALSQAGQKDSPSGEAAKPAPASPDSSKPVATGSTMETAPGTKPGTGAAQPALNTGPKPGAAR